jgi:hypothetical protein
MMGAMMMEINFDKKKLLDIFSPNIDLQTFIITFNDT